MKSARSGLDIFGGAQSGQSVSIAWLLEASCADLTKTGTAGAIETSPTVSFQHNGMLSYGPRAVHHTAFGIPW